MSPRAPRGSGELLREEILDAATDLLLETGHGEFTDRVLRAVSLGQITVGVIGADLSPQEGIALLKGLDR